MNKWSISMVSVENDKIEEYIEYSFDMNIGLFQVHGIKRPWHSV